MRLQRVLSRAVAALCLLLPAGCGGNRTPAPRFDARSAPVGRAASTEAALRACAERFGEPAKSPQLLSIDFAAESGRWLVQHVGGAWPNLPGDDWCAIVVDGANGAVVGVRRWDGTIVP
jgi:hypothetical protein